MLRHLLAALSLSCMLIGAQAQALDLPAPRQGLEVNLGAGAILYPAYPGAKVSRVLPYPLLSGGYGNRLDFDILDGLRLTAFEHAGFSLGPALRLRFGRGSSDHRRQLHGLRSFGHTIEGGGFIAYERGPFYADATLTQDLAQEHKGLALDLRALLSFPLGRGGVQVGPQLRVVNRSFAQSYFGIDPINAAASGRPAYRAGGGLERAGALVNAEFPLVDRLAVRGIVEWAQLGDQAARSPLVRDGGSRQQVFAGLFLVWRAW